MKNFVIEEKIVSKTIDTPSEFDNAAELIAREARNGWICNAGGQCPFNGRPFLVFYKTLPRVEVEPKTSFSNNLMIVLAGITTIENDFYYLFLQNKEGDKVLLRTGYIVQMIEVEKGYVIFDILHTNYRVIVDITLYHKNSMPAKPSRKQTLFSPVIFKGQERRAHFTIFEKVDK